MKHIIICLVIGTVVGVLAITSYTQKTPKPWYFTEQELVDQDLLGICHDKIRNQLKSPTSAVFLDESPTFFDSKEGRNRTVGSYVDSQNSFGAVVREKWICSGICAWNHLKSEPYCAPSIVEASLY